MKRLFILVALLILLAACGTADPAQPEATNPLASGAETAVSPEPNEPDNTKAETAVGVADIPGFPAETVEEASIVRDRDWKKGAADPVVTVIEYGDFQ